MDILATEERNDNKGHLWAEPFYCDGCQEPHDWLIGRTRTDDGRWYCAEGYRIRFGHYPTLLQATTEGSVLDLKWCEGCQCSTVCESPAQPARPYSLPTARPPVPTGEWVCSVCEGMEILEFNPREEAPELLPVHDGTDAEPLPSYAARSLANAPGHWDERNYVLMDRRERMSDLFPRKDRCNA